MNQITVRKEVLVNLGNFSNIKIGAEITTDLVSWEDAWLELNQQIRNQEIFERSTRLGQPKPTKEEPNTPDVPF